MAKKFNVMGSCNADKHYMVDIHDRLVKIKEMVDEGLYFTINRARQYGKTTTLRALKNFLSEEYIVVGLDFQKDMSTTDFYDEVSFVTAFSYIFMDSFQIDSNGSIFEEVKSIIEKQMDRWKDKYTLTRLFKSLSEICRTANKPIVLIIDEVDSASNNQVFLDFLAQLRGYYLNRDEVSTFHSVILAGVHDVRNIKQKIRPDAEHKHNSPWNIAAKFNVDMSFSALDISGMLEEYENDHHTEMNISEISGLIYDYTSGYPVLVSMICKLIDEEIKLWNNDGVVQAVKMILKDDSALFESLMNKVEENADLYDYLYQILIDGVKVMYNPDDSTIKLAMMYGFVKEEDGSVVIANRIFETRIYNAILTAKEMQKTSIYKSAVCDKNEFIQNGKLDMEKVLSKFVVHYNDIYGSESDKFLEEDGRKLFLLYLRPIINGVGHYYIEAQTRDMKRTDVVVNYNGVEYVIELKIWRGEEYNASGEKQIAEYLDYFHLEKGYMLSFNFNKIKEVGTHRLKFGEKELFEAVV